MNRQAAKEEYERSVFDKFLSMSKLNIDNSSIKNGDPNKNEPDLICSLNDGALIGYELGRLTDPKLSASVNRWEPINGEYIRTSDPSRQIARNKITKRYKVPYPVELLLYKEQPIVTPDNVILPTIRPMCQIKHGYSKIWYMGNTVEVLYENS